MGEARSKANNDANLGFESKLWEMADKLRGHMDASEYKHVVLGLIFLEYIGELVKLVGDIDLKAKETGVRDSLGGVCKYFLGRFAAAEGKGCGDFYTPSAWCNCWRR